MITHNAQTGNVCVFICVCIDLYMCMCLYIWVCLYILMCMNICVRVYVWICWCVLMSMYMLICVCVCMCACMCMCVDEWTCLYHGVHVEVTGHLSYWSFPSTLFELEPLVFCCYTCQASWPRSFQGFFCISLLPHHRGYLIAEIGNLRK